MEQGFVYVFVRFAFAAILALNKAYTPLRHSRESGNPVAFDFVFCKFLNSKWIPAFAGMTAEEIVIASV